MVACVVVCTQTDASGPRVTNTHKRARAHTHTHRDWDRMGDNDCVGEMLFPAEDLREAFAAGKTIAGVFQVFQEGTSRRPKTENERRLFGLSRGIPVVGYDGKNTVVELRLSAEKDRVVLEKMVEYDWEYETPTSQLELFQDFEKLSAQAGQTGLAMVSVQFQSGSSVVYISVRGQNSNLAPLFVYNPRIY